MIKSNLELLTSCFEVADDSRFKDCLDLRDSF